MLNMQTTSGESKSNTSRVITAQNRPEVTFVVSAVEKPGQRQAERATKARNLQDKGQDTVTMTADPRGGTI